MLSEVISKKACESNKERYVNHFELYHSQFRRNQSQAFSSGHQWEHDDIVTATEQYCERHAARLLQETIGHRELIPLLVGPKTFLLNKVYSELRVGNEYGIELVICEPNQESDKVLGRLDLKPYVIVDDIYTGKSVCDFENNERVPLTWMEISSGQKFCLCIRGAIRVISSIDCLIQVKGESE